MTEIKIEFRGRRGRSCDRREGGGGSGRRARSPSDRADEHQGRVQGRERSALPSRPRSGSSSAGFAGSGRPRANRSDVRRSTSRPGVSWPAC